MAKKEAEVIPAVDFGDNDAVMFGGRLWLNGRGATPARVMIVGDSPNEDDVLTRRVMEGGYWRLLNTLLHNAGFTFSEAYYTLLVKYAPPRKAKVKAGDIKACAPTLMAEIERVQPEIIVCLGSNAFKAIAGSKAKISQARGEIIDHPTLKDVKVLGMYSPAYIQHAPTMEEWLVKDIKELVRWQQGKEILVDTCETYPINTTAALQEFANNVKSNASITLALDMEWHGVTWMDPNRYVRTIQIGYELGRAAIVHLRGPGGVAAFDNEPAAWAILKDMLEAPNVKIMGHNIIADGHWLLGYGIDIRNNVIWDTMLAEHLLKETGPWSLDELALKYTNYGRYSLEMDRWIDANKSLCKHGYGYIPDELLLEYGAIDVDAVRMIAVKQKPLLAAIGVFEPRGIEGEHISLWDATMGTQRALYEVERCGLLVDNVRLEELIDVYQKKCSELRTRLSVMTQELGVEDFNPNSPAAVSRILFSVLRLPPVKTTDGKAWSAEASTIGVDDPTELGISTDSTVLEILQDAHPFVTTMLDYRRIHQICKTWLRHKEEGHDESTRGGGLPAKIWPDGRIHARFSQLAETGRFRTSNPNVQNWPKRAEGALANVFKPAKVPEGIRTIIVPPPGYVLLEADFSQAELFVLAALSGDTNMWEALRTPGKDLHDLTAISAFRLTVLDASGNVVPDDYLVQLAAQHKASGGADSPEFNAFVKSLTYVDQKGHRMTREEFKDTIRVSAKNVNFGIPYGRGAAAIAQQVKAETGSNQTIDQLTAELTEIVNAWKVETYPKAWEYMQRCAASVYDPGYLVNPWGRYRRFLPGGSDNPGGRADMERQAQNFPIQSTVADTAMIAMIQILHERGHRGLHFKLVNQIHDAIMLEVPEGEIEETKQLMRDTMGSIDIPVGPPFDTLRLGIDLTVFTRWGDKA